MGSSWGCGFMTCDCDRCWTLGVSGGAAQRASMFIKTWFAFKLDVILNKTFGSDELLSDGVYDSSIVNL